MLSFQQESPLKETFCFASSSVNGFHIKGNTVPFLFLNRDQFLKEKKLILSLKSTMSLRANSFLEE